MTSPIQLYKQAYSGLSRNSWLLSVVMLINRSGTMVIPFLSLYCTQQLHFTVFQAGCVMATFGAGAICGAFFGGRITDKYGFYDVQIFALISGGIFFLALSYQHSFWLVIAGSFILSCCNDSFRPANSTAIAYYSTPENKTRSYSLNRLAVNLGWAFGGALGGVLAAINFHLLFWVDGCTNIVAAIMLLRLIPRTSAIKPAPKPDISQGPSSAYKDKIYIIFIILVILYACCFFQLFSMQPLFYNTIWHLSKPTIGALMAMNGVLICVIEMVLIHNLEGKRHPLRYITIGVLLVGAGFVVLNTLPAHIVSGLIAVLIITFGEMMSMPFINAFWIERSNDHNRGEYAAIYSMAWSIAQIVAPLLGGYVVLASGNQFYVLWWILGAVCLLSAVGFSVLYKLKYSDRLPRH
jgi:predicted MFS family arabinose efflux permease